MELDLQMISECSQLSHKSYNTHLLSKIYNFHQQIVHFAATQTNTSSKALMAAK
ncbi:hypothetical protein EXN66_Car017765 [Channa argus]|uniref:Uncharacterized protein n=1 Tax=Channa argus TaxID=215402 RepID=A0A6G1QHY0_CHAAH|nr:hypothetical protein EXN66_Car017765 [Channa argus]